MVKFTLELVKIEPSRNFSFSLLVGVLDLLHVNLFYNFKEKSIHLLSMWISTSHMATACGLKMIRIRSSDRLREQFEVCVLCVPKNIDHQINSSSLICMVFAWCFQQDRYDGLHKVSSTSYIYSHLIKATQFVLEQTHGHSLCMHSFRKKDEKWLYIFIVIINL
jgi:hypothetical protein